MLIAAGKWKIQVDVEDTARAYSQLSPTVGVTPVERNLYEYRSLAYSDQLHTFLGQLGVRPDCEVDIAYFGSNIPGCPNSLEHFYQGWFDAAGTVVAAPEAEDMNAWLVDGKVGLSFEQHRDRSPYFEPGRPLIRIYFSICLPWRVQGATPIPAS